MSATSGGGGSVSEGSEAGESSQSTMSVGDSPSTSFQPGHGENVTKITLSEGTAGHAAAADITGSKINLTLDERQAKDGVVNMAFDYEEGGNRTGGGGGGGGTNADFKSINGSEKKDKVPEAVNLELVNMVPYSNGNGTSYGVPVNGIPGIPVKKDSETVDMSTPYDEYFVPVNEHKKYMRGEKLYVTKDKRRPTSWRRCLSWIVACTVISVVLIVAILAGTGVILSQEQNLVKEASIGRNFAGANLNPSVTQKSSVTPVPTGTKGFSSSPTTDMSYMYVPRSIESQLIIDNLDFDPALLDTNSSSYHQFAANMEDQLKMILFEKETLEFAASDVGLRVVNVSRDPFKVNYRIGWNYKQGVSNPPEPIKMEDVKRRLVESLARNQGYIGKFHIDGERIKVENVINTCQMNNGGCSHICYYNYHTQLFTCTCPTHLVLDGSRLNCVEWTESSEQDFLPVPERDFEYRHHHEVHEGIHQHGGGIYEVEPTAEPAPEPTAEPVGDRSYENDKRNWVYVHSETKDHEPTAEPTAEPSPDSVGHGGVSGFESKDKEPAPEPTPEPGFDANDKEHSKGQDNMHESRFWNQDTSHGSHSWEEPSAEPTPEPGSDSKTQEHLKHHDSSAATHLENEPSAEPTPEPSPKHEGDEHSHHYDSAHGSHSGYFIPDSKEREPSAEPTPEPSPDDKEHEPAPEPTAEPAPESKDHADVSQPNVQSEGKEHEPSAEPTPEPSPDSKSDHQDGDGGSDLGVIAHSESKEHEPSAEPEPTPEPNPGSKDDHHDHTGGSYLGVIDHSDSKEHEPSAEPTPEPSPDSKSDHQDGDGGSYSGVIAHSDSKEHEPSAEPEPTPEPSPDSKDEHHDQASGSLSGIIDHSSSKEHEPSAEPEPTPEPSPDSEGEHQSSKSHSGVQSDDKEHEPSAEPEPTPEPSSGIKEHDHESATKPAIEHENQHSVIQAVNSESADPQPTAEPIPEHAETTISPKHSQSNQHSIPFLEQILINDSYSHEMEHPIVKSDSEEEGKPHPESTGHHVPSLQDILVKEPESSQSNSTTDQGGVIIEDIISKKSSPEEAEETLGHTEMPGLGLGGDEESKPKIDIPTTGVVADGHDFATVHPGVSGRDPIVPTTIQPNAQTIEPESIAEDITSHPKIIEYITINRNSNPATEQPQSGADGHSKPESHSEGSSLELTTRQPESFTVPVSIVSGDFPSAIDSNPKELENKTEFPEKTEAPVVEPNQNISGPDAEEKEEDRLKTGTASAKPDEIKTEHLPNYDTTTVLSTVIKNDNLGKEVGGENNSKEGIEITQKGETDETTKSPEELSNNIKDESPDNEEFNTLLEKDFKSKENFSGEGKDSVKYSSKPSKVDKKRVKDYIKGEKIEGDKRGGEGTVKPAVTPEDLYLQKHVNGNENAFDLDFGLQNEHTTDGEVTGIDSHGVPGVSFQPHGISNHDIRVLQTVAPDFRTETNVPGGWPQKGSTGDKEGESKLEKEYSKFDKDYKYEKQKGAKKKELKKKVGGKDGKNVELEEGRKYYTEVGGKEYDVAHEIQDASLYPVDYNDHEVGVKILPKVGTEENGTEIPESGPKQDTAILTDKEIKTEGQTTFSPIKHEGDVAGFAEHEIITAGVTESKVNVAGVAEHDINAAKASGHEINPPEVTKHETNDAGVTGPRVVAAEVTEHEINPAGVEGPRVNADGVTESSVTGTQVGEGVGVTEYPGVKVQVQEGSAGNETSGEGNAGMTEQSGVSPVGGFIYQQVLGRETNSQPRNENDSTLNGHMIVNEPSVTSPGAVRDGTSSGAVYSSGAKSSSENLEGTSTGSEVPGTVFDGTATYTVHGSAGEPNGNIQNSSYVIYKTTNLPRNFAQGLETSNSSLLTGNNTTAHPTIIINGQSGSLQDGHSIRFSNGTGGFMFNGSFFNPEGQTFTFTNYTTTFPNGSVVHPTIVVRGQSGALQDGHESRFGNFTFHKFTAPGVFTSGPPFDNSTVYRVENATLPGTVFDGHFNPQDGHYHMFTNSSGTYVYRNASTQPTFFVKGTSGDFGNVTAYILGNHTKSFFNVTGSQTPFQVKFSNATSVGGGVQQASLQPHGSNESITFGHQISPTFFSSGTAYNVNNYFGYISKCAAGQFQCVNGTSKRGSACISLSSKCDSINDCSDGSDEQGCIENGCPGNFQCSDGTCLKRHLVCNGIVDCSDGSDEKKCESWKCEFDEFQCPSGRCIPVVWQCDNKPDCDNHTDENRCQTSCGNDEFLCPEGWCIPLTYKCNGIKECSNGEDEQLCDCSHEEFKCQTGGCVSMDQVCNGLDDCPDRSDEWGCVKLETESNLLKIRTASGDYEPICADNWSAQHSDEVCASLGYFSSAPIENETNSSFTTEKSFYVLKNDTTEHLNKKLLVNLMRSNGTCSSGKMVEVACQEFSCGSRSMTDSSSVEARLVGGMSATAGQWPSVALLYNIRNFHSCTANVVTPRWVLASYNCLKMGNKNLNQQDWKMFGGSTVFEAEKENAETRNVVTIVPHPQVKFNQFLFSNDLALVELDQPLQFTTSVGAVCLPEQEIQPRQICVTAGWGMNTPEDKSIRQQLQYLPVPTMNLTECNSTEHYSGFITEDKICAGYNAAEKSLCYNEEGAPLMCVNDRGEWELQGVLSYHSNCGRGSHPSIFSSITPVKDWIKQTIGNNFERKSAAVTKR